MANEPVTKLISPYRWELKILSKGADAACIIGILALVCWLYDRPWHVQALPAITATVLFQFFGEIAKLYRSHRSELISRELLNVCGVWLAVVFALLLLGYAFKASSQYSRLAISIWFVAAPLALCSWRLIAHLILRRFGRRGHGIRTVAIAGASGSGIEVAQIIGQSTWMGLRLTGFFDDRQPQEGRTHWTGNVQGNFDTLIEKARNRSIDVIYIALPLSAAERTHHLIDNLADTTVSVYVVPETFWINVMRGRWVNLGNLPTVSIFETPFYGLNGWLKRVEDLLLGSIILTVIALPMLLIGLAIALTSRGPVLFKQKRYGLAGEEIEVWKFRTMRVCENGQNVRQARKDDDRVTPLGRFLRKTSLDELPQFINVLQGSMSIVGPRPHAVVHNEFYRAQIKGYMLRHKVPPGITGWAQINGWRGQTDSLDKMQQRFNHDLYYIQNWSVWFDIKIIFLTLLKGFGGKNAY